MTKLSIDWARTGHGSIRLRVTNGITPVAQQINIGTNTARVDRQDQTDDQGGGAGDMVRKHQVFISYSSKDRGVADALFNELESTGVSCWMAPGSIGVGNDFADAITHAIKNSEAFILVFSANTNGSEHCQSEVSLAFDSGIRLVPFRIENVDPSPSLQYFLAKKHWLDASSGPLSTHIHALNE